MTGREIKVMVAAGAAAVLAFAGPVADAQLMGSIFPGGGGGGKSKSPTVVKADTMDIDMKGNLIVLTGSVEIDEEGSNIKADKITIYLKASKDPKKKDSDQKEPDKINASGNVVIIKKALTVEEKMKGDRKATAGNADYSVSDGMIVLTEKPVIDQGKSSVRGNKITIWRDSDRMVVERGKTEDGEQSVISLGSDEEEKKDGEAKKDAEPAPGVAPDTAAGGQKPQQAPAVK